MVRVLKIFLILIMSMVLSEGECYAFFGPPLIVGVIEEPSEGYHDFVTAINSAHTLITMTMYELRDPDIVNALIQAVKRRVRVEVILDRAYHGGGVNQASYTQLHNGGVLVRWAPENTIYHEKSFTIDNAEAYIGTGNLDNKFYTNSVDAWVYINDPDVIKAMIQTFHNDELVHTGTGASVSSSYLIWAPHAKVDFLNDIHSAHQSIDIIAEELEDPDITAAIANAAQTGIACRIIMTYDKAWLTNLNRIENAGCTAMLYPNNPRLPYFHEKMILVDGDDLILGSQNLSTTSLVKNRELSIHLHTGSNGNVNDAINRISLQFNQYFSPSA